MKEIGKHMAIPLETSRPYWSSSEQYFEGILSGFNGDFPYSIRLFNGHINSLYVKDVDGYIRPIINI